MANNNSDSMSKQAQHIWAMLDDMADNDPSAYKKFIERQLKGGKEYMAPPDPHMCVQVMILTKPSQPLFINFCAWNRVPEPKSPEDPVPVSGTLITYEGSYALTSVAFNPKVLQEFGRCAKNPVDGDTLIQLALDYIEKEQKVSVSRTYTVLPVDTLYKGDLNLIRLSFTKLTKNKDQAVSDISELEDMFGPLTSNERENLLHKLSNISNNKNSSTPFGVSSKEEQPELIVPGSNQLKKKNGLIEEIKEIKLPTPKYSLEPVDSSAGRNLVLKVDLPGVKSVAECELDISEDDVKLLVSGMYELKVKLPSTIEEDDANAKFSKKNSVLTLSMPVRT
ncbi:PIH1 domain-containing protein 2-like [Physella acuta]|uniref:PIH1 domain-containing protein 2-like n=1 Tax=Physella acuta TaxID=109671 RepID=UPI0027DCAA4A|nr:PIH1 domain-containing protein 2-like [Physella acuta]